MQRHRASWTPTLEGFEGIREEPASELVEFGFSLLFSFHLASSEYCELLF